jgi:hypothetical protein
MRTLLALFCVIAFADDLNYGTVQTLIKEGHVEKALFVLSTVAKDIRDGDPAGEHYLRAEAFFKRGNMIESLAELNLADEFFKKHPPKMPIFTAVDSETLRHAIEVHNEKSDYIKRPFFTQAEANKAAIHHARPHLELKNGIYRIHFRYKKMQKLENGGFKPVMVDNDYRTDSVDDYYAFMRNAYPTNTYRTEFHTVRVGYGTARTESTVIYDEKDELKSPDDFKADDENYRSAEIHPLSLVGNVFTYKSEIFEDNPNTSKVSGGLTWTAIDLKNGKPAELLDYVTTDSLAAALRSDPKLKAAKDWPPVGDDKKPLDDDATIDAFRSRIEQKDTLDFAFYDYDPRARILTVNILATPASQKSFSNDSFILTLKLKPTVVFEKSLHQMNPKTGFYQKTNLDF